MKIQSTIYPIKYTHKHKSQVYVSKAYTPSFQSYNNVVTPLPKISPIAYYMSKLFQLSIIASRRKISPIVNEIKAFTKEVELFPDAGKQTIALDINKNNSNKYLIIFHGTSQNVTNLQNLYNHIVKNTDFAVLAPEYRGFGKTKPEKVSEKTFLQDSLSAYNYLTKQKHIKSENIYVMGHSFGGFVASQLAAQQQNLGKLILMASIDSLGPSSFNIKRGLKNRVPKLVEFLLDHFKFLGKPLNNVLRIDKFLKNSNVSVEIIHSQNDKLVSPNTPINFAKFCKNLSGLHILESGGHRLDETKINMLVDVLNKSGK